MRIECLKRHGKVNHPLGRYLDDLPPHERQQAETLLNRRRIQWVGTICRTGGSRLVGQARLGVWPKILSAPCGDAE
jgi:hypothetical protein